MVIQLGMVKGKDLMEDVNFPHFFDVEPQRALPLLLLVSSLRILPILKLAFVSLFWEMFFTRLFEVFSVVVATTLKT